MRIRLFAALLLVVCAAASSRAQLAGTAFTYQGQFTSGGTPANGDFDFRFRLFDALTGGTQQGPLLTFDGATGDPAAITVTNGLLTTSLDFGNQFNSAAVYLQIAVRSHGVGSYTVLSPRQQLTPAPYAMGLALPSSSTIATSTPALSIANTAGACISLTGGTDGIDTVGTGSNGNGIFAECDNGSFAYGVWGKSTSGIGVVGDGTGTAAGGQFTSASGTGLTGLSYSTDTLSTNGVGIYGMAHLGSGVAGSALLRTGIWGDTDLGTGVVGTTSASATNNAGVLGLATGSLGSGVFGVWQGATGFQPTVRPGVWGDSNTGDGVVGTTTSTAFNSAGVLGASSTAAAVAVWGENFATSGTAYGVLGSVTSAGGYAGFFDGRMTATGTKAFQIDHPLDPENKYLNHYCTESPEPQNAYNGIVTTDANGDALVSLPDYFQEINKDPRYTLTIIDDNDFAMARVSHQIEGNRFAIKTSRGNVQVSWEVKAMRNDRFVQAYGAPSEQAKPDRLRGTYLRPELYGVSSERGQFYRGAVVGAKN